MSRGFGEVPAKDFDLALTLNSGQVFHWKPADAGWIGMIGDRPCYAEQRGPRLFVTKGMEEIAARYFALDHPMVKIHATFPDDEFMRAAVDFAGGLRIIRQPKWECIATFITSSQKSVKHIAQISHMLRERFGKRVQWESQTLHTYPTPSAIAALDESDLRKCALGYRAKNLLKAARQIAGGEIHLDALETKPDDEVLAELCKLGGVGPKVANCVLLFAYERLAAFPIDVWIERVLRQTYFLRKRKITTKRMRDFAATYFGPYGGYAQQYLFHHARQGLAQSRKGAKK